MHVATQASFLRRRSGLDPRETLRRLGIFEAVGTNTGNGRRPKSSSEEMRKIVFARRFPRKQLSLDGYAHPVTLLETNACSPLATNAMRDNIWDNFSSESYKDLPSVGSITVHHPITGEPSSYKLPAGGVGYTRVPSLVSLWSTAPFLLNNSVGTFKPSPGVKARMQSFHDSIEQLLWPEKRDKDPILGDKVPGVIDRTTTRSYVRTSERIFAGLSSET